MYVTSLLLPSVSLRRSTINVPQEVAILCQLDGNTEIGVDWTRQVRWLGITLAILMGGEESDWEGEEGSGLTVRSGV